MKTCHHLLAPAAPGTRQELVSLHYGPRGGAKCVIQASLHADEVPAMLVAHHLRGRLAALESAGRLRGEVVLVPAANPLGLAQRLLHGAQGRFDLASGENFNRHHADLAEAAAALAAPRLGADAARNVAIVREALRTALAAQPAATPLESLRRTLLGLAIDADIVLDLHCDGEALLHFYAATPYADAARLLARCLGAEVVLLAGASGGHPFDEACSLVWPALAERFGAAHPLPPSCFAVTIELRGEADVAHPLAERDAGAILHYLAVRGFVDGPCDEPPPLIAEPTPLAGSMPLAAPHGGVIVFLEPVGARVAAGQPIAELIDPITGAVTPVASPVEGLFFARDLRRFAVAGMTIGKVAGTQALRSGALLSP